ncbi:MAG: cation-translocating P-type ATPase [Methylobacterium sp.]|nr:cation-translocating P-type ATPase [Methylobacterium sp.]MCA3654175.1 cation-translocating P-type ATPase [Methylobacterium sp.]MCA3657004.1 cation-translocating P-type ATPase [Methylobacterium sp.]MCA3663349.1 cation-translocating P-type ATPase [Methylobacterium sp.]MCA3665754.1 cation-translocating P-type ATPase [Methylobacterium sp.]
MERPSGLSSEEARRQLALDGFNELPKTGARSFWRVCIEVLHEPMLGLLLAGGLVYLALGDRAEALILLCFAMLSISITVVQEMRTERVLEALRDLTSPRALVIRDGQRQRIPGREVVRGDLILLAEGDRVPADADLVEVTHLELDESLLTGESVPVRKRVAGSGAEPLPRPPGESEHARVYSGSLVVRGSGLAMVHATGPKSEIGRIGASLAKLEGEAPRLRAETRRLVRVAAFLGIMVSLVVVLLYGLTRADWLAALLAGIALGMAMLPEEFPVVLTVFLAMGAWRISKARVLTRRSAAIETLGATTVLCTDKTGTLTENRMSIVELWKAGGASRRLGRDETVGTLEPEYASIIRIGRLASAPVPFDPMERAFLACAGPAAEGENRLVHGFGLTPHLLAMTQIWEREDRRTKLAAAKGAPEAIMQLCAMDEGRKAEISAAVDAMAARGLRVLGVAGGEWEGPELPHAQTGIPFAFLGLVGLADPLRASVPDAIRDCRRAGIHVVMITGDHPVTAREIARQAGLEHGMVVTGAELDRLDDAALRRIMSETAVFARISPEQKLRIVEAFKARGEIVAMTGDGVNDAPSLKAAHIGVAMGGRGTDVAREASSIVLLDDDFGSIVEAIRLGRRIYDNLRKAMGFIIAVHVPIAGMALLPLVLGMPILFTPIHIAFLEMVIDPVSSLAFEAEEEEADIMARPPRKPEERLVSVSLIGWAGLCGTVAFLPVAAFAWLGARNGMATDELRALVFVTLVLNVISLIFVFRAFGASLRGAFLRPNRTLFIVLAAIAGLLALSLLWPQTRAVFRFVPLQAEDLLLVAWSALAVLVGLEAVKKLKNPVIGQTRAATKRLT